MAKKSVDARYEERNRKMRAKHTKKTGKVLGKRHTSGTAPARVKFACRFGGMAGGMTKPNGEPTNLKMALKKWGFGSKGAARKFCNRNKKSKK